MPLCSQNIRIAAHKDVDADTDELTNKSGSFGAAEGDGGRQQLDSSIDDTHNIVCRKEKLQKQSPAEDWDFRV